MRIQHKIHVLTVKLTVHIPIDPADGKSREVAGLAVENLIGYATKMPGETIVGSVRQQRIFAPQAENTNEDDFNEPGGATPDPVKRDRATDDGAPPDEP